MGKRGRQAASDERRWITGALPSKEYFEKVYREERERAKQDVAHALQQGRRRPARGASAT